MELTFLFKGIIIGLAIAAPVGPIGVLCIRRTLASGWLSGFFSGLGAATADFTYGLIAAFGLAVASDFLLKNIVLIKIVGGGFLLYLGVNTYRSTTENNETQSLGKLGYLKDYSSTVFLTLTNPATILSFLAIFAVAGVAKADDYFSAGLLALGVLLGSSLWWFLLSMFTNIFKRKMNFERMMIVNKISGIIIGGFGFVSFLSLIGKF